MLTRYRMMKRKVLNSIELAQLGNILLSKPDALSHNVGEGGVKLSGDKFSELHWQKLSITISQLWFWMRLLVRWTIKLKTKF